MKVFPKEEIENYLSVVSELSAKCCDFIADAVKQNEGAIDLSVDEFGDDCGCYISYPFNGGESVMVTNVYEENDNIFVDVCDYEDVEETLCLEDLPIHDIIEIAENINLQIKL